MRNRKITQSAKGERCTVQGPYCNRNPETVVYCHVNDYAAGKGLGVKAHDDLGFYGCSGCHDAYDRRRPVSEEYRAMECCLILRALIATNRKLKKKKII